MPLLTFSDNLFQDAYISFKNYVDSTPNMLIDLGCSSSLNVKSKTNLPVDQENEPVKVTHAFESSLCSMESALDIFNTLGVFLLSNRGRQCDVEVPTRWQLSLLLL